MKLLRYGPPGQEKPGLLDAAGTIRDLSGLLDDLTPRVLAPAALDVLRAIDPERLPKVAGNPRLGVPWSGIGKYVAIGLNYSDHAAESGMPLPVEPTMFTKWLSCLCGPNDDTIMPAEATKLDWEVELGIVIGRRARQVSRETALDYVAGYVLANDISERGFQIDRSGGQWSKGKGFDTFGPVGPWLVTRDEIADPQCLDMWLNVNGVRRQTGNTAKMIFKCDELVAYCSRVMTLEPGDLIITGTPPGVGLGCKPPQFLKVGDVVELGVAGLGQQRQVVVAG
ncbi:fumarylacetoacetate hydrolase family protein [Propionivibrio dicarboxylicus]|uniref:2-keto-4-pentenoate hydratase/2-oxohepta-3-ene-1,7-dioic acid hydratase (Catechol pathway) n=1 Tax=Propionivibrio dicarboxylicus TaxID=83767 RepID=A0A1G7UZY0_9RHOO|nr:fumarylacetoacetate hydrolase family protein [Propionivibrio dicarboxylicus]SDG53056.1 2-keto-4-pentenoate hydratase/2-oxohepta-3-ene-1,7-dioic acid hydratase (catechol pathway) [Propionivibrio dicarboxylicus]